MDGQITELERMSDRIGALERSHGRLARGYRRWRGLAAGALACLGAVTMAGAASRLAQTMEAEEFVLRDKEGAARAALAVRPDGTAGLGLFDGEGRVRLSFDMSKEHSPGVNLYDASGKLRSALAIRPDGTPGLGLFDKDGKARLSLDIAGDGSPGVNLYDRSGALRAAVAIRPDGTPGIGLFDERGEARRSLEIGPENRTTSGGRIDR